MATDGAVGWGDVSVWVNVACPSAAHRRALWIASTEGALPMPHKPRAGSYESVALEAHPPTPPTGTYLRGRGSCTRPYALNHLGPHSTALVVGSAAL